MSLKNQSLFASQGGPHGLGDPCDERLRKVEIDVMIPKKMRDIARTEKCHEEVEVFTKCCKTSSVGMVIKCRTENKTLLNCLSRWYNDQDFQERCKREYIQERNEYRRTGLTLKQRMDDQNK